MKINRFGRAETLSPQEITLLFSEGFVKPRDRHRKGRLRHRALFGVCLYAGVNLTLKGRL